MAGRRDGGGGCLGRIVGLLFLAALVAGSMVLGSRLLWLPEPPSPPDPMVAQRLSQRLAALAMGKLAGPFEITQEEADALAALRDPASRMRARFGDGEITVGSLARPLAKPVPFLPEFIRTRLAGFSVWVFYTGRPDVENGELRLEPLGGGIGTQRLPGWAIGKTLGLVGRPVPSLPLPSTIVAVTSREGAVTITTR